MSNARAIGRCTEFSNDHYTGAVWGPSTDDCDYIELFVAGCSHYPEATEVDIRGWIVDDNANNFNSGGGCTGNILTTAGHLRFADSPTWESVPVGSIIVLYNTTDNASCFNFTADLTGSGGVYYIPVGSTGLIQASSDAPTSSSCDYCTATYASYNPWWGIVTDNERDAIQVRCPGCGEEEGGPSFYHGLSWGTTDMGPIAAGGNDLGGAHMNMSGRGKTFILDTDEVGKIQAGLGWTSTTAMASRPTAGSVSSQLRAALLGGGLPCCAGVEVPAVAQKATYRFGFNGMEKVDEMYGSTGNSYDFGARLYDPRVGRWLSLDPLVDDYPSISPYSYTNNNPILFIDPDGKKIVVYVNGEKHEYIPNTKPKSGSPDILFKLHEAISYNMKTEIGKSVWSALGETDKVVNIRFRDAVDYNDDRTNKFDPYMVNLRSDYTESLGTIFWDSDSKVMVFESKENGERGFATGYQSPSTVLLHEAGHAYIMLQALLTGVGGDEWKLYKEEGNDDLGQDKVYRNKEERKVVEEIEQPYIGQINAIEGINGSYQQSRSNSYGQVQFRDNQSNVNGGQTKVEQTNELNR